jgi:hypothetical protein
MKPGREAKARFSATDDDDEILNKGKTLSLKLSYIQQVYWYYSIRIEYLSE